MSTQMLFVPQAIHYMTSGMDMSGLFPVMCSCANLSPDDVVLKKMLYLYITHYSALAPELALLTINQLHKDTGDQDPMIRGLALRSLCSLRVSNFVEYVLSPIDTVRAALTGAYLLTLSYKYHFRG